MRARYKLYYILPYLKDINKRRLEAIKAVAMHADPVQTAVCVTLYVC